VLALLLSLFEKSAFFCVYTATIAYVVLYLAYVPAGPVRNYNRFGDYSYGIYIYAFPVQQSVAALVPDVSVFQMIWISGVVTILLAVLSWDHIERRALSLKSHCIGKTRSLIALGLSSR
jgi:peptidoglycan/LPS O-acetylase OafA/YrhL